MDSKSIISGKEGLDGSKLVACLFVCFSHWLQTARATWEALDQA